MKNCEYPGFLIILKVSVPTRASRRLLSVSNCLSDKKNTLKSS